jgi:hypothetical protein
MAWAGDTVPAKELKIGIPVQVVPRIFEDSAEIKLYLTVENRVRHGSASTALG